MQRTIVAPPSVRATRCAGSTRRSGERGARCFNVEPGWCYSSNATATPTRGDARTRPRASVGRRPVTSGAPGCATETEADSDDDAARQAHAHDIPRPAGPRRSRLRCQRRSQSHARCPRARPGAQWLPLPRPHARLPTRSVDRVPTLLVLVHCGSESAMPGGQPSAASSAASEGAGSGRRIIRKERPRPSNETRSGTRRAT